MRELPRAPPVISADAADKEVLRLLRAFGKEFNCSEGEITQACNLASGPSDIVVILERPAPNHNYEATFEEFVSDCKTLKAVDELIRFATNRARSIYTVSILDTFSFKTRKTWSRPSDEECNQLLSRILRIKKPKVVLGSWSGEGPSTYSNI